MKRLFLILLCILLTNCAPTICEKARSIPFVKAGIPTTMPPEEGRIAVFVFHIKGLMGADVEFCEMPLSLAGSYDPEARMIHVNETLDANRRFFTIAHEAAHVIQPLNMTEQEGQVWAGIVAYHVSKMWGVEVEKESIAYLSMFKGALGVEKNFAVDINWAVSVLTGIPVKVVE